MRKTLAPAIAVVLSFSPITAEEIFAPNSKWETVTDGHQFAEGMAFDQEGHFFFTDVPRSQLFRIDKDTGKKTLLDGETGKTNGIAFGPDGRLFGCAGGDRKIYAWDPQTWKKSAVAEGTHSNDLAIRKNGTIYYTEPRTPRKGGGFTGSVYRVDAKGGPALARKFLWHPNGIAISPDDSVLFVAEFASSRIHAFEINPDNTIGDSRPGYTLKVPANGEGRLDGMFIHHDGRVVSGTALGAQIAPPDRDPARPTHPLVIPIPNDLPRCNYVRLSPDRKWLYAAHAKAILRRELDPAFTKRPAGK